MKMAGPLRKWFLVVFKNPLFKKSTELRKLLDNIELQRFK